MLRTEFKLISIRSDSEKSNSRFWEPREAIVEEIVPFEASLIGSATSCEVDGITITPSRTVQGQYRSRVMSSQLIMDAEDVRLSQPACAGTRDRWWSTCRRALARNVESRRKRSDSSYREARCRTSTTASTTGLPFFELEISADYVWNCFTSTKTDEDSSLFICFKNVRPVQWFLCVWLSWEGVDLDCLE